MTRIRRKPLEKVPCQAQKEKKREHGQEDALTLEKNKRSVALCFCEHKATGYVLRSLTAEVAMDR